MIGSTPTPVEVGRADYLRETDGKFTRGHLRVGDDLPKAGYISAADRAQLLRERLPYPCRRALYGQGWRMAFRHLPQPDLARSLTTDWSEGMGLEQARGRLRCWNMKGIKIKAAEFGNPDSVSL